MTSDGLPPDDLEVHLEWPGGDRRGAGERPAAPDLPRRADDDLTDEEGDVKAVPGLALVQRSAALQATAGEVAGRLDAIAAATASLRTVLGDRMTDIADQVDRAHAATKRDSQAARRTQERTLADIEAAVGATEQSVHRLDLATVRLAGAVEEGIAAVAEAFRSFGDHQDARAEEHEAWAAKRADAADEQVAAIAGDLAQLRTAFDTRTGALEHLASAEQLAAISGDLTQLRTTLDNRTDALEHLASAAQLAAIAGDLTQLRTTLDSQRQALGAQRDALDGQRHALDRLAAGGADAATAEQVRSLAEAVRHPAAPEEVLDALRRIEEATRSVAGAGTVAELEQTVTGLAQARAEDVERILQALDDLPGLPQDGSVAMERAAARLDVALDRLASLAATPPAPAPGSDELPSVLGRLDGLITEVESLRRRIALRARPEGGLDRAAIDAVADAVATAVAARLGVGSGGDPLPPKRGRKA